MMAPLPHMYPGTSVPDLSKCPRCHRRMILKPLQILTVTLQSYFCPHCRRYFGAKP